MRLAISLSVNQWNMQPITRQSGLVQQQSSANFLNSPSILTSCRADVGSKKKNWQQSEVRLLFCSKNVFQSAHHCEHGEAHQTLELKWNETAVGEGDEVGGCTVTGKSNKPKCSCLLHCLWRLALPCPVFPTSLCLLYSDTTRIVECLAQITHDSHVRKEEGKKCGVSWANDFSAMRNKWV